jgi:hypothetical protein
VRAVDVPFVRYGKAKEKRESGACFTAILALDDVDLDRGGPRRKGTQRGDEQENQKE